MTDETAQPSDQIAIRLDDVKFSVSGKDILKGVSFSVDKGEIVSVMGMSGCGKTTLLHCLGGLTHPTSGQIYIGDNAIVGMPERELNKVRESMGMVFQYAALFDSLTVFENVAFGLRRRRKLSEADITRIVKEKLALAAVPGTERLHPSELSGGMAKRVGLARALALEPTILMYDEPTSGLDPVVASVIDEQIISMRDQLGVTSVVVSHNVSSVFRMSDHIAMLHEGHLWAFGTPDEIRNSPDPVVQQFIEGRTSGPIEVATR
ncbi:MAG TPA: ATP-binding cassette domain-containing protein [Capsulimonadaceae bacterium]|jgi:phospholipid/cholesterol/gamma-HCH transport system ATP-binding protein